MHYLVLGLLALYVATRKSPSAPDAMREFVGPPAPAPEGSERPPQVYGDQAPVQTGRFVISTSDKQTDQRAIESLFVQASVNGWYVADNGNGTATIELRDVNLEDAWLRLLELPDVFVDKA